MTLPSQNRCPSFFFLCTNPDPNQPSSRVPRIFLISQCRYICITTTQEVCAGAVFFVSLLLCGPHLPPAVLATIFHRDKGSAIHFAGQQRVELCSLMSFSAFIPLSTLYHKRNENEKKRSHSWDLVAFSAASAPTSSVQSHVAH